MEITGELFVDVAAFRRMAKAEFGWVQRFCALSMALFVVAVLIATYDSPLGWAIAVLALVILLSAPLTPVGRLTRIYALAGPIVWRFRVDERGFRITGRRTIEGGWAHYTRVAETADLWLVRPRFGLRRIALPKAAFTEADRRVVAALLRGERPATVAA